MKNRIVTRLFAAICALFFTAACLLQLPIKAEALSIMINSWDTYDDYKEGIRDVRYSLGFVKYKDIKVLGEFEAYYFAGSDGTILLTISSPSQLDWDLKKYTDQYFTRYEFAAYELTDENQFSLDFTISDRISLAESFPYRNLEDHLLIRPEGMTDMRYLSTQQTGYIQQGSLVYHYIEGRLYEIFFRLGETCFKIGYRLHEYPRDGKRTIISQMLSADETVTERAYRRLIADIPAQAGYYKPLIVDSVAALCLTGCVCLGVVMVIKRIRKRKAAACYGRGPCPCADA